MNRYNRWVWMVPVALIAFAFYRVLIMQTSTKSVDIVSSIPATTTELEVDKALDQSQKKPGDEVLVGERAPCDSAKYLNVRSQVTAHQSRMDRVSTIGPVIESYRNLNSKDLHVLAIQGDSAAMVVLGAVSEMRSRKWSEDRAVSYLLAEDPASLTYTLHRPFPEELIRHLDEAKDWYFQAALHGRILALQRVGFIEAMLGRGPVELGWVTEHEYEALTPKERNKLQPTSVYSALPYEIAPELRGGLMSSFIRQLVPTNLGAEGVIEKLKSEFTSELEERNLLPISVKSTDAPPLEVMLSGECEE